MPGFQLHAFGDAVVGHDIGARDKARRRARHEDDHACDFLHRPHAPAWDLLQSPIVKFRLRGFDRLPDTALEIDRAGRHDVHPDGLPANKLRELLGIRDQSRLDGVVGHGCAERLYGAARSDDDNGAAAGFLQVRHECLASAHRMQHVDFEVLHPAVLIHSPTAADACDEDIAPAKRGHGTAEPSLVGFAVTHIDGFCHHLHIGSLDSLDRLRHLRRVACAEANAGSFSDQELHHTSANALGRPGDDYLLALQPKIHCFAPSS